MMVEKCVTNLPSVTASIPVATLIKENMQGSFLSLCSGAWQGCDVLQHPSLHDNYPLICQPYSLISASLSYEPIISWQNTQTFRCLAVAVICGRIKEAGLSQDSAWSAAVTNNKALLCTIYHTSILDIVISLTGIAYPQLELFRRWDESSQYAPIPGNFSHYAAFQSSFSATRPILPCQQP